MKRIISFTMFLMLLLTPLTVCFGSDSNDNDTATSDGFLETIYSYFPESIVAIDEALSNDVLATKEVEYECSKYVDGNKYILTIYSDDTIDFIESLIPVCIDNTRSNYSKDIIYHEYRLGHGPVMLILTIYYTYTGANTAPIIYDCDGSGSYVTVLGESCSSTYAYTYGNAFYYDEDAIYLWEPPKVYYAGLFVSATSDTGHNFLENKYAGVQY